ncbi:hypothetical protein DERP_003778 [Dermatophagoides pteronyssinus]|uniref:Suppressor protein SRP40-like n=1 Tax=Dermatophagoides pteronyssinus TaxID=6956 RepID=A0ABQ8JM63_DERPT|nr:hypothetical protein DERP_003778 [Dermatophagoides pteronyssinus]
MTSKPAEDVVVPDKQIDSNNVDNQTIQKNPNNKDDDPGSEGEYRSSRSRSNSSSIRYRSSSAEPIEKHNNNNSQQQNDSMNNNVKKHVDHKRSKSRSRSPRQRYSDNRRRIDFRNRNRQQFSKFHHRNHNQNNDRFDNHSGFNRNRRFHRNNNYRQRRNYSPSPTDSQHSSPSNDVRKNSDNKQIGNDLKGDNGNNQEKIPTLKPSDIKNSAKQSAKSFLDMLEEKRMMEAFPKTCIVAPEMKKQIPVKIPKFVNTFNTLGSTSLATDVTANNTKSDDQTKRNKTANDSDSDSDDDSKALMNSSREEGEIRSDLEDQNDSNKKRSKKSASSSSSSSSTSSSDSSSDESESRSSSSSSSSSSSHSSSSSTSSSSSSSDSESNSSSSDSESNSNASSSSTSLKRRKKSSKSKNKKKKSKDLKKNKKRTVKQKQSKKIQSKKRKLSKKHEEKSSTVKKSKSKHSNNDDEQSPIPECLTSENIVENQQQQDWPTEMLLYTKSEPIIQFSINQKLKNELVDLLPKFESYHRLDECESRSAVSQTTSSTPKENDGNQESIKQQISSEMKQIDSCQPIKLNMNHDYDHYYQYYYDSGFPCINDDNELHLASHFSAYYRMFNSYDYNQEQLTKWASNYGYRLIKTNRFGEMSNNVDCIKQEILDETKKESNNENGDVTGGDDISHIKQENNDDDDEIVAEEKFPSNQIDSKPIEVITTNNVSSSISSDYITYPRLYPDNNNIEPSYSPPPSPPPKRPMMTVMETTDWITLPNGIKVGPGTKQIIVHPYNRPIF